METLRTKLTLLKIEDFPEVLTMFHEPDTTNYIKHLQNLSTQEYETILGNRLAQIENKIGCHWTARLRTTNEFIGALNLSPIPNTEMIQIGFQLRTKYWNQGFASELAKKLIGFGIREMKLKTIYGVFEKENVASRKVLEKLGFGVTSNRIHLDETIEVYQCII